MDVLLGVGNDGNGDDGIGPWIAQRLSMEGWHAIDCFTVPENYTGEIRRLEPRRVVIVDAADMGLSSGAIRRIPRDRMGTASFSTHAMPLSVFIDYLADTTDAAIVLVGVQPRWFNKMSSEVMQAGERLLDVLHADMLDDLLRL
jgi:hydrogenase 3 maturation protease